MKRMQRMWTMVSAVVALATSLTCGAGVAQAEQTAPAAQNAETPSITITGDVEGRTFTAYQLGTYTNAKASDGTVTSVEFNTNAAWSDPLQKVARQEGMPVTYTDNAALSYITTLTGQQLRDAAMELNNSATGTGLVGQAVNGTVRFTGLTPGYYLITDTNEGVQAGAPMLVGTAIPADGTVYTTINNGAPLGQAIAKPDKGTTPKKTVEGDTRGTVSVGDKLTYTITTQVPGTSGFDEYSLTVRDVASSGLTMPTPADDNAFTVKVGDTTIPQDQLTITQNQSDPNYPDQTVTDIKIANVASKDGQQVTVSYTATVNTKAVMAAVNTAYIKHNDGNFGAGHKVDLKTYSFEFTKVGPDGATPLQGAEFQISGDNIDADYTANGASATATSNESGVVKFSSLAAGTYTVKETKAPEGYMNTMLPSFTVTIKDDGCIEFGADAIWNLVTPSSNNGVAKDATATVKNVNSITQLPLTGAAGITLLVVVAALLAAACMLVAMRSRMLKKQLED